MAKRSGWGCCVIASIIIAVLLLALGLVLLIAVPTSIMPSLVKSQVPLTENEDGSYSTITGYWQKLPVLNHFHFYFFNITNMDDVTYSGAKPYLVEIGPYTYIETEFKEGIEWQDDNNRVFYRNNKTWVFNPSESCKGCDITDVATLPNAAYMTAVYLKTRNNADTIMTFVTDLLLLLTGEAPVRTVPIGGVLFDSYSDPLINFMNSNLTALIKTISNGTLFGLPVPDVQYMGYFPKYNHTADENFVIRTGRDDVEMAMGIEKWAGSSELSWWKGDARKINGTGDGTFYKPMLTKTDVLGNFQTFTCRAFDMEYSHEETYADVDSYVFKIPRDSYDSTIEKNRGYQYSNPEKIDYFPAWPKCKNHTFHPWDLDCSGVDCTLSMNFCDECCNGSHGNLVDNTPRLPPGIVPIPCFPGRNKLLPFAGFISPPHFLNSPKEIRDTMVGFQPDREKHDAGVWWVNPTAGATLHALFRMQFIIPIFKLNDMTLSRQLQNSMLPTFWVEINAQMKGYAHNYVQLATMTAPKIVLGLGISSVILCLLLLLLALFCYKRRSKAEDVDVDMFPILEDVGDEVAGHTSPLSMKSPPGRSSPSDGVTLIKKTSANGSDSEQRPSAQMFPELYARESPEGSLQWRSSALQDHGHAHGQGHDEEAWQ